ncbi:MAG: translation initiation factor IF-3 [Candidatus Levybacteria bacterium]|nr:translation initiation factor IF-3 [Candidatus Levybacteria bacterium]
MIKKFKKYKDNNRRFFRTNERIFAQTLRVLDSEGKQIGVLNRIEAFNRAREEGLDLVEIAPKAVPPVAKIIDFKKFLYQLEKKKKEEKKKSKASETKEVRLGPFMNDHDLEVMIRRARGFLKDGDKVRMVVKFIGRQITHPEFGKEVLNKALTQLSEISKTERDPHFEGKQLITIIVPERSKSRSVNESEKSNGEEKNKEISGQTV